MPKIQAKADYSKLQMEQLLSTSFLSKNIEIEITDNLVLTKHKTQKLSFIHSETPDEHLWTICYQSDNNLYFFDSEGLFTDHFNSSQFVRDNHLFLRANSFHFHICESWFAYDKYKQLDEDGFTEYGMTGPLSMALARCILNNQGKISQMVADIQPKEPFAAHRDWSKIPNPPKQNHTIHHVNLLPGLLSPELKNLLVPYSLKVVQDERRKTALQSISEQLRKLIPPVVHSPVIKQEASPTKQPMQSISPPLPMTEPPAASSVAAQHSSKATQSLIAKQDEKMNELNQIVINTLKEKDELLKTQQILQSNLDDTKKAVIQAESQLLEARATIALMINKLGDNTKTAQEIEKAYLQIEDLKRQRTDLQSSHFKEKQEDSAIINKLKKEVETLKQNHQETTEASAHQIEALKKELEASKQSELDATKASTDTIDALKKELGILKHNIQLFRAGLNALKSQKAANSSSASVTIASESSPRMTFLEFDKVPSTAAHSSPTDLTAATPQSRSICEKDLYLLKASDSTSKNDGSSMLGETNLEEKQAISDAFFKLSFSLIHRLVLTHKVDSEVTRILNFPGYGPARINALLRQLNHGDTEIELSMLRKIPGHKLNSIMGVAYDMSLAELISSGKNKLIVSENHVDPFAKRNDKKHVPEKPRYLYQRGMYAPKRARIDSTEMARSTTPSNHVTPNQGEAVISNFINSDQQFNAFLALIEKDSEDEISNTLHV